MRLLSILEDKRKAKGYMLIINYLLKMNLMSFVYTRSCKLSTIVCELLRQ